MHSKIYPMSGQTCSFPSTNCQAPIATPKWCGKKGTLVRCQITVGCQVFCTSFARFGRALIQARRLAVCHAIGKIVTPKFFETAGNPTGAPGEIEKIHRGAWSMWRRNIPKSSLLCRSWKSSTFLAFSTGSPRCCCETLSQRPAFSGSIGAFWVAVAPKLPELEGPILRIFHGKSPEFPPKKSEQIWVCHISW